MGRDDDLRRRAEARWRGPPETGDLDRDRLLVELSIHQTELELQNEELQRVQHDLQIAHDTYQDLFEQAPVGYLVLGARAQIIGANLTAAEMLGVTRDRLIGKAFPAFIDPAEAYRFHLHHQQVFEHPGIRSSVELQIRRGDDSLATMLIEATCLQSAGGQRLCRTALTDVTERRRAAELLGERQARLSAILNTVVDAVITVDDTGVIESVNAGTSALFGYPEGDLVGQPIALLMPEPHRSRYRFLMSRYLDHGQESILGQTRQVPARRRDGSIFPAELTVGELLLENNRRYVGVVRDVSARKDQDTRLRESLARFQEIADRIEDTFYIAEPSSGRMLYVSPAFTRVFGRSLEQAGSNLSWLPWVHSDDRERVRAALAAAGAGHALDEEYRIVRPDGTERLVRDRGFLLPGNGRITGILRDITEERRLEEELRHAQRLEAVGTLASGIAHDFNNLLMGLAGLAKSALRALPPDHAAAAYVRRSLESTERGAALTRQLLMFSGQRRAQAVPVELDAACRAAGELLDRLAGEHIHLTLETGAPGLGVLAEPGEIEQILLNLVANSRDAMPSGGELGVKTEASDDGASVSLSVSDTGMGMEAETKARLFEPFFTTKGVGQGTGLGLSTVFAVARQRGGEVRVDSELGRGTVVTIRLPVVARDLPATAPDVGTPRGTETILAVEDDPLVRETIEVYLRALGYHALVADRPGAALALAVQSEPQSGSIDLLLTDVMMPGQLGGELSQQLLRAQPSLQVLYMSAHPQSELLRLKRIGPADPLLCKPFGQHQLGVALRAVLDAAPSRATGEPASGGPASSTSPPAVLHQALIVDDDHDVAEAIGDALAQLGWAATIAHSGREAIELAGKAPPDVVLCDVTLGREMSGYDVARAIRADARLGHPILIAVTGLPSAQCAAEATDAGFDRVLAKPIELDALERLVRQLPTDVPRGSG